MEFVKNYPIYLQIEEIIYENILKKVWKEEDRLPSVRELAAKFEVNSNTVQKTVSRLGEMEILETRRGVGLYVKSGAFEKVREMKQKEFFENELIAIANKIKILDIQPERFCVLLKEYFDQLHE